MQVVKAAFEKIQGQTSAVTKLQEKSKLEGLKLTVEEYSTDNGILCSASLGIYAFEKESGLRIGEGAFIGTGETQQKAIAMMMARLSGAMERDDILFACSNPVQPSSSGVEDTELIGRSELKKVVPT